MTSDQPISARKLPVKRKSPESPFPPNPNPNPNPNEAGYDVAVDEGEGRSDGIGYGDDYDEEEEEEEDEYFDLEGVLAVPEPASAAAALPTTPPPPFKFQRIWSESDEIRFLQGLLACRTQGLTFPRDLNLFFDRFSETMTQPYTRTQLYEKLRRLRKKFRIVSARVSRGLDPSTALTPHDRDLLHVSTQLWHPSCASSSPFSSPGPDNKRRRTGKSARSSSGRPRGRPRKTPNPNPNPNLSAQPTSPPPPPPAPALQTTTPAAPPPLRPTLPEKVEFLEKKGNFDSGGLGVVTAKAIRDVFDSSLEEVRMELVNHGLLYPDHSHMSGSIGDLTRMCQEQRVGELDAMARRLKLLLEHAIQR